MRWPTEDVQIVRWLYPYVQTDKIAALLGRKLGTVHQCADRLGIRKTPESLAAIFAARPQTPAQIASRFQPGHSPANKGLRRPGWAAGRMRETQFKKGNRPHTWLPIGSLRTSKDGYLQRKVTETGYPPRDWVSVHHLVWQRWRGPIPPGHIVVFRDGNPANRKLANLECISKAENLRRNSIQNLPPELRSAIQLAGALNRQINRRTKDDPSC
jgi:hypothetical protein